MFTLYYHPACYTSYRLLSALKENKLTLNVIDLSTSGYMAISKQILTVPLIETDGKQIYGGPIDIGKAVALISQGGLTLNVENVRQALVNAIADSAAASAIIYSFGRIKPIKEFRGFLSSATGIALDPEYQEKMDEINRIIGKEDVEIYNGLEKKMIATLAFNKVRESMYMNITDQSPGSFILWFVSKSSIGRAGVPFSNIDEMKRKALKIHEYYIERKDKIEGKLLNEINEIKKGINDLV